MQQIPLSPIPAQTLSLILDGQYCTLAIYWRQERLYLDLHSGQAVICQGAICENRADIVQSKSQNFKGSLHFLDTEGDKPPHWEGLNNGKTGRWLLLYAGAGEELPESLRH